MRRREALDWSRFLDMFGREPDPTDIPKPKGYATIEETFLAMGKDVWERVCLRQAPKIIRQLKVEAKKAGVGGHLQYLFFLLFERTANWPPMAKNETRPLLFMITILSEAAAIPNYNDGFRVPPEELEPKMAEALKSLAVWGRTGLRDAMLREYLPVVVRYAPLSSLNMHLRKTDPERVRAAFEAMTLGSPGQMGVHGYDLWTAITIMQG